jgi:hypothetical protein
LYVSKTPLLAAELINKTQLRSAATPALSSSVASAFRLQLPGATRRSLSAAANALLSLFTIV